MVVINKRILVVDDEEIVRKSCQRALTEAGYAVRTVGSGRDALRACRAEPVDVMLTDLRMPDMNGLDVIRAVAKEFPDVRVVIITGYPSQESVEQAEKLGISNYLEKPLSPKRLSAAAAEALAHPPRHTAIASPTTAPGPGAAVAAETKPHGPESEEIAETDVSTLKALALLAVAPIIGGVYVMLLPAIGFGMLVAVLGTGLAAKLGRVRK